MSEAHQRLADDHEAVGEVLKQLLTALQNNDAEVSFAKLDLLWARLAVHIRAEHRHLFPAVLGRFSEAQAIVDKLRADHDFFMHELPRAIGILRELSNANDRSSSFSSVRDTVLEIERRLVTHNELEENQIYRWAGTVLTETEQVELATRINGELENRPPRFTLEAWANQL